MDTSILSIEKKFRPTPGSEMGQALQRLREAEEHLADLRGLEAQRREQLQATKARLESADLWVEPADFAADRNLHEGLATILKQVRQAIRETEGEIHALTETLRTWEGELGILAEPRHLASRRDPMGFGQAHRDAARERARAAYPRVVGRAHDG